MIKAHTLPIETPWNDTSFFPIEAFQKGSIDNWSAGFYYTIVLAVGDPRFNERWGYKWRGLHERKEKKNERKKNSVEGKNSRLFDREIGDVWTKGRGRLKSGNKNIDPCFPVESLYEVERKKNDASRRRRCTVHAKWENFVDLNKKDNKGGLANLILVTTTSPSIFNALGGFFQLDFAESEITCTDSFAWIRPRVTTVVCIPPSFESWSAHRFPRGYRRINFKLKFCLFRVFWRNVWR